MTGPVIDVVEVPDEPAVADPPAADETVVGADIVPVDPSMVGTAIETTGPSASQFQILVRQSELLAGSDIIPRAYRGKPANILVAGMTGLSFGWDPLTSMRNGHVIEGVWSMKPEAMVGLVRRAGHKIEGSTSSERAEVKGTRGDDGTEITVIWTMEDARRAKLHNKDNWQHYPASMLWARAVAQLCRMLFADVLLGVAYTPEELGADVDEHGEVIDVAEVAQTHADGWGGAAKADAAPARHPDALAPEDVRADLVARIAALPEGMRRELADNWRAEDSRLRGWKAGELPERLVKTANAMINAFYGRAAQQGVDMEARLAAVRAGDTPPAADTADTPAEAGSGDPAPPDATPVATAPVNQADVPSDPPPPAETEAERTARKAAARALAKAWAGRVRDESEDVLDTADRIAEYVGGLHHTAINNVLATNDETAAELGPGVHIDTRRMGVVVLLLRAFKATGELPEGMDAS